MRLFLVLVFCTAPHYLSAADSSIDKFIDRAFPVDAPQAEMLWLDSGQREQAARILGRRFSALRVRYWRRDDCSAWVMDEIGKERPITIGVIVAGDGIKQVEILEYRESRGGEVRYPFFTSQFVGAGLDKAATAKPKLSHSIDGISGATLSVRAVKKIATLALLFHRFIDKSLNEEQLVEQ